MFQRPEQFYEGSHAEEDLLTREGVEESLYDLAGEYAPAKSPLTRPIEEKDFIDVYGELEIERDKAQVKKQKEKHLDQTLLGTFAESALVANADKYGLLGKGAMSLTYRASQFDDFFNHMDAIVEIETKDGWKRFGIDVTTSTLDERSQKLIDVKENLERGILGRVKYFESEDGETKGMTHMPRILLAVEKDRIVSFLRGLKASEIKAKGKEQYEVKVRSLMAYMRTRLKENTLEQAGILLEGIGKKGFISNKNSEKFLALLEKGDIEGLLKEVPETVGEQTADRYIQNLRTLLETAKLFETKYDAPNEKSPE